jgi:hypothetical protein
MDHCELQTCDERLATPAMPREASFLLAALRNDPAEAADSVDWAELLVFAETHGVLPSFCRSYSESLPETFIDSFRRQWTTSALLAGELEALLELFQSHEIEVLPLKGPLLAEHLYGSVSLRTSDDLDLLVHASDFHKAQSILTGAGFLPVDEAGNYHQGFINNGVIVEVHFAVASPSLPQFDLEGAWARSNSIDFRGHATRIFEAIDLALYLVLHGVKHHFARLIWLLDVARALEAIDDSAAEQLLERARRIGVTGALLTTCQLVRLVFGNELPPAIGNAIEIDSTICGHAALIAEGILSGPAEPGTPPENAALFLQIERNSRSRWAHRLRFLLPTQQDYLWARRHGIHPRWIRLLRPWRLLLRHGPTVAVRTVFPPLASERDPGKQS